MIPWDHDFDLAICQEDHDDILKLSRDPEFAKKYRVMDWSPADAPKTFMKLYVKATGSLFDIYHYEKRMNPETSKEELRYLLPHYDKWYMPEPFKIRERPCLGVEPATNFFPLRKALLDGVPVHIPAKAREHLNRIYEGNLDPAKVWDESQKAYVNVPGHPYWRELDN